MENSDIKQIQTTDTDVPEAQSEPVSGSLNTAKPDEAQGCADKENGGYEKSAEPTRYGDWEIAGRCVDF